MNLIRKIRNGLSVLRQHGLLPFIYETSKQLCSKEEFCVLAKGDPVGKRQIILNDSFVVKRYCPENLDDLLTIWPNEFTNKLMHPKEIIVSRYNNDIPCFILSDTDGELAGAMWIDNIDSYIDKIKFKAGFHEYLLIKNIFIKPAYRGQGLGVFLLREAIAQHSISCSKMCLSLILPQRKSSLRIHEQVGFCKIGQIYISRFLFWENIFFKNTFSTMHDEKKTLLIITDTRLTGLGGSEKHIRFLMKNLPEAKYNIFIAELQGQDKEKSKYDILRVEYRRNTSFLKFNVKKIYGFGAIKAYYGLQRIINNENVDIVLSFHEKSDILNSLLKKKYKDKIIKISSRRDLNICPSRVLIKLRALLLGRMDFIIAPSKSIISFILNNENYPSHQTRVIPNSIDVKLFNNVAAAASTDIKELITGRVCGVCVANLKEVKGHKYLVEAFHLVCVKYPDAILLLVGADSGEGAELQEQINILSLQDNIHFLGRRTDVSEILHFCHYMVSASLSEGLSNALIEGLASGLPLVATDVGGNSEIVDDGVNGFLCEPRDPESLANSILLLLDAPEIRSTLGDASCKFAEQKFHQDKVIAVYEKFFDELINSSAR